MRRRLPGVLVILASIVLLIGTLSVWIARQVLDTNDWVRTSNALIRDPRIQQATASYAADQLLQKGVLTQKLKEVLPPRLDPLAATAAGGLDEVAQRVTLRALQSGAFQKLWEETNRNAHKQLINVVEHASKGGVVFDLRPMLGQVATRIGLSPSVVDALPPDRGKVTIIKGDELSTVRSVMKALRGLAIFLVLLTLVLWVAAVWLSYDKRRTILQVGVGIFLVALVLLAVRRVLGHIVVDDLTSGGSGEPSAQATWDIGTSLLRQITGTLLVLGLIVIVCAAFAGPSRWATRTRRWLAPALRDQPVLVYSVAFALLLILLAVGLLPGSSRVIPVLIYLVLVFAGISVLRREALEETAPP
jgi:hypothetical protein